MSMPTTPRWRYAIDLSRRIALSVWSKVRAGREADALLVGEPPHGGGIDRPAEMNVKFGQLVTKGMRHLERRLAEVRRRPSHAAAPPPEESSSSTRAISSPLRNGLGRNRSAPALSAHSPVERPDAAMTGVAVCPSMDRSCFTKS